MNGLQIDSTDKTLKDGLVLTTSLRQHEDLIRKSLDKGDYKQGLHYSNQVLSQCTDSIAHIGLKVECLVNMEKLEEAADFMTHY